MNDDDKGLATAEAVEALAKRLGNLEERVQAEADGAADCIAENVDAVTKLRADLAEVTHDLTAVVTLLGHQVGEPFRSQAAEIIAKRQTGG